MWPFFNPTIEVVTFRLRGWCMLGVFLLPAFTRLGHERRDLLSSCDRIRVCTVYISVYSLTRKSFGGMESEPMLTPRETFPRREKISPDEDRTHDAASSRTASPTHYQRTIPAPLDVFNMCFFLSVTIPAPLDVFNMYVSSVSHYSGPSWRVQHVCLFYQSLFRPLLTCSTCVFVPISHYSGPSWRVQHVCLFLSVTIPAPLDVFNMCVSCISYYTSSLFCSHRLPDLLARRPPPVRETRGSIAAGSTPLTAQCSSRGFLLHTLSVWPRREGRRYWASPRVWVALCQSTMGCWYSVVITIITTTTTTTATTTTMMMIMMMMIIIIMIW